MHDRRAETCREAWLGVVAPAFMVLSACSGYQSHLADAGGIADVGAPDGGAVDAAEPVRDAGVLDDATDSDRDSCVVEIEICNGIDDDCNGTVDDGLVGCVPPRCAPLPSGDTRWAQYPMPGTPGHTRDYQVTGTPGAETAIDCVTGLEWQRAVDPGTYTQAGALAYCDGLTLAGYTDWRLPSRIELVTLVDYHAVISYPTLDATAFPGTPGDTFWSASSVSAWPPGVWYVHFYYGNTSDLGGAVVYGRARCVRGSDAVSVATGAPPGHFTDPGDGTVRDNLTGLVWQQGFSPSTQSQAASATYCSTLAVPSGGGWRLPTVAELQTLVDETVFSPAIDAAYFPSTPAQEFWSASSVSGMPSDGWYVGFSSGSANFYPSTYNSRARCVR